MNASSAAILDIHRPVDGKVVGSVPLADGSRVQAVTADLRAAQTEWRDIGPAARAVWPRRWRTWILEHTDELSDLLVAETGKVRPDAAGHESGGRGGGGAPGQRLRVRVLRDGADVRCRTRTGDCRPARRRGGRRQRRLSNLSPLGCLAAVGTPRAWVTPGRGAGPAEVLPRPGRHRAAHPADHQALTWYPHSARRAAIAGRVRVAAGRGLRQRLGL